MFLARIAWASMRYRRAGLSLQAGAMALTAALVFASFRVQDAVEDGVVEALSRADLVIGPRDHDIATALYGMMWLGTPRESLPDQVVAWVEADPRVAWVVPIATGDSVRRTKVVGTTSQYFTRLLGIAPSPELRPGEGVLGASAAERLGLGVGDRMILSHGSGGMHHHHDAPVTVAARLPELGLPADDVIFVHLQTLAQIHHGTQRPNALLLGLRDSAEAFEVAAELGSQLAVNAVLPAVAVRQLWSLFSSIHRVLFAMALALAASAVLSSAGIMVATLGQRQREAAILRAVGASPSHLAGIFLLEALILGVFCLGLGWVFMQLVALSVASSLTRWGVHLHAEWWTGADLVIAACGVVVFGCAGLIPAVLSYRQSLHQGLTRLL